MFKQKERVEKLNKLDHKNQIKLIFGWVKQNQINTHEFDELLDFINETKSPTNDEIIQIIFDNVSIRGINLEEYSHAFRNSNLMKKLEELYTPKNEYLTK